MNSTAAAAPPARPRMFGPYNDPAFSRAADPSPDVPAVPAVAGRSVSLTTLPKLVANCPPLDPRTYDRGLGCVHCGLCLPACPTYTETGHEADGPRGRIATMLALSDGRLAPTDEAVKHLDGCLDCRACETACPSGVVYHELIEETRTKLLTVRPPGVADRLTRAFFFHVLTRPTRLKLALLPARLLQKVGLYAALRRTGVFRLLPSPLRKMERMLPPDGPLWPRPLPAHGRAGGVDSMLVSLHPKLAAREMSRPKLRVGFLGGCVGSVMFEKVNRQAAELLGAAGADVLAPPKQRCCGAIHHHAGDEAAARDLARRNIDAFDRAGAVAPGDPAAVYAGDAVGVDVIVTTVAGCGATLREYGHLLRDDPGYARRAEAFAAKVRDVTEVLADPALALPPMRYAVERTVAYHDACHLAHAQKVTRPPRDLLARVPGLTLVPLPESDTCCGAAGTYNLTQPAMATRLADRKLDHVASTGATTCATGNVGCAMHLAGEAAARGQRLDVVHPVELLHLSAFGPQPVPLPRERLRAFVQSALVPIRHRLIGA